MTRPGLIAKSGLVAAVIAAVFTAGWFIVAGILKSGVEGWIADRRADGWTVEHGPIDMGGFPFTWTSEIGQPRLGLHHQSKLYRWSGPSITLNWKPWAPRTIRYATGGRHVFHQIAAAPGDSFDTRLDMTTGKGRMAFGSRGHLDQLTILVDGGRLSPPQAPPLHFNRFQAVIDNRPPPGNVDPDRAHLMPSLSLDSEVFGLTLASETRPPLGRTIGRVAVRGTIMGQIRPGPPSDTLAVWQKDGGTVEISRLDLGWGPLAINAAGTVALDAALQPVAALTGRVTGYAETIEALVTARMIKPRAALIGKFALASMARPSGPGGQSEIRVPVTVQNRWLSLGPLQLLKVPEVRWN